MKNTMNDAHNNQTTQTVSDIPHYRTAIKDGWGREMYGLDPADGSDNNFSGIMGLPITNFTVEASGIKKARVKVSKGKWLPYKTGYDIINGIGNGQPITAIELVGSGYFVAVHAKGGSWLNTVTTSDVEGAVIVGGGMPIDAIWIEKA